MSEANADTSGPHKRLLLHGGRADFKPRCLNTSLSLSYFQLSLSNFQLRCIYHSIISEDYGDIECLWLMLIPVVLTRDYCQRKTEGPQAQITRQIPSSLSSSLDKYYHHCHHHTASTIISRQIPSLLLSSLGKYYHYWHHNLVSTIKIVIITQKIPS